MVFWNKPFIPWYPSTLSKDCKFNISNSWTCLILVNESEFRTFLLCPTFNSLTSVWLFFIVVNRHQLYQLIYHPPIFLYHLCFKNEPSQDEWCLKINFSWLRCDVNYCGFLQWSVPPPTCREFCNVLKCSCLCSIVSRQNFLYQAIFLWKGISEWKNCLQMDKVLRERQCFDGDRVVTRSFRSWSRVLALGSHEAHRTSDPRNADVFSCSSLGDSFVFYTE